MTTNESTNNGPEFGSQPGDIAAFNELSGALRLHNSKFTIGILAGRTFVESMVTADRVQNLVDLGLNEDEAEQAVNEFVDDKLTFSEEEKMARSVVGLTNMSTMEQAGLKLSPQRVNGTRARTKVPEQTAGVVRFQIADGGKFSNFLLHVQAPDDELRKSVEQVVANVVSEAKELITDGQDDQVVLETLVYAPGVVKGLQHVGLETDQAKELQMLYEHSQAGDVSEYVAAKNSGLLTAPADQNYGPAQWQLDSTNERLVKQWDQVLDVIRATKAEPKSDAFFNTLIGAARESLAAARSNWGEIKAETLKYGNGSNYDAIFESVGLELDLLASRDE